MKVRYVVFKSGYVTEDIETGKETTVERKVVNTYDNEMSAIKRLLQLDRISEDGFYIETYNYENIADGYFDWVADPDYGIKFARQFPK